jgi:hypothetical protein
MPARKRSAWPSRLAVMKLLSMGFLHSDRRMAGISDVTYRRKPEIPPRFGHGPLSPLR